MSADLHALLSGILQSMSHDQLSEEPLRIAGLVVPVPAKALERGTALRSRWELSRTAKWLAWR